MPDTILNGIRTDLGKGGAGLAQAGDEPSLYTMLVQIARRLGDPVADEAALAAIAEADRYDGQIVMVGGVPWNRDDDSTATAVAGSVVTSDDSTTGRWLALGGTMAKRSVAVVYTDLAAGNSNGASVAINIGAALPANARITGVNIKLATPFTGGSASAVTVDIGTTGDPDALVDGADVFAAAVDGQASTRPLGIAPNKHFATEGAQLKATFAPDGSHQLANLTAGSCTIEVLFTVLA